MAEAWILMKCGCRIDCNVKPGHAHDFKRVHLMPPVTFQKERLANPKVGMPTISIEAHEDNWKEVRADYVDRETFAAAHEFIQDSRSTMAQRRKSVLKFRSEKGHVPRCWVEA